MNNNKTLAFLSVATAFLLVAVAVLMVNTQSALATAPTPVSAPAARQAAGLYFDIFKTSKAACTGVLIADGRGCNFTATNYGVVDLQYVIDQGSTVNTTTLTLQYSNDGIHWTSGPALVSANVADTDNLIQYNIYGRYVNVYADVANTEPVTVSVSVVAK